MIEKTFYDRVPTYPGRVKMTPVYGQANTYDMVRADDPTTVGTPIDKAVFDSITQSRLTGRYYTPTVARSAYSNRTGITANPIPASGWSYSNGVANSGLYTVKASSVFDSAYSAAATFDASSSYYWQSASNTEAWLQIYTPSPLTVKKVKLRLGQQSSAYPLNTKIQGSNNGTSWADLYSMTAVPNTLTEYTLTTTGAYSYYRLYFTFGGSETRVSVFEWVISEYDVTTYSNAFTVAGGFPATWTEGQRVTVAIPTNADTFATVANTLNGVAVIPVLQPGKRYELRYTGANFAAKEV